MSPEPTIREVAERYVADLPPTTDCAFNVAKKGSHRFCSHADVIAKAVFESIKDLQAQKDTSHD